MLSGQRLLMADIKAWQYRLELAESQGRLTGRHLLLVGRTRESTFLPPMELNLEIDETDPSPAYPWIESADGTGIKIGEMVYHPRQAQNGLPDFVHGSAGVSKNQFCAVLEMMQSENRCNGLALNVQASLYGLDLGNGTEADRWPEGKTISVTDLKFTLIRPPVKSEPAS